LDFHRGLVQADYKTRGGIPVACIWALSIRQTEAPLMPISRAISAIVHPLLVKAGDFVLVNH